MLIVSSLCQSLYPTLVYRTNDHVISSGSTNGTLTSQYSWRQLSMLWLVSCLSTLASICLILSVVRSHHRARNRKQSPKRSREDGIGRMGGLVRRTTNRFLDTVSISGSYQKLGGGRDAPIRDKLMRGESRRNFSEVELAEQSEDGTPKSLGSGPYRGLRDEDSRYEPMRHHHGTAET